MLCVCINLRLSIGKVYINLTNLFKEETFA